ncbi:DDB1- and CUL4-associated factor 8 [Lucilia sericata]|uniref:DDB1- and CUL4-associated factor 8 n=1 Tax=Lucilia sericata TaxID=13632 RepID=UPI0018A814C9|nr:DDB1- and CUL4-associated factor 8 [Lucilia sericata]
MEEAADFHEESAPKRSRSDEEIKEEKDVFSSSDSGQQSPHDIQQQEQRQQNMSACCSSSNNNSSSNNHINNNSDSGLSLKMEDSSCGDADLTGDGVLRFDNDDENTMATIVDSKPDKDQQMLSGENSKADNSAQIVEKVEQISANTSSGVDLDKPTTSTNLIKRHKRNRSRNYRVADRSSSSSSSSSPKHQAETQPEEPQQDESQESVNAAEDPVSPANNNAVEEPSPPSPYMSLPNFPDSSSSSSSSDSTSDSDDDDTDFEPSLFADRLSPDFASNDSADSNRLKEKDEEVNKVLNKQKPPYTWCGSYELMRREHGLSGDGKTSLRNGFSYGFKNRFYASRHIVERMKISHVLRKHNGCVNCVNFNKNGDLLVTGSDDARLIVWDWAANKTKHVWKSGHSANIFQSKFLPSSSCIDIISAGRDGKVRRSIVPPSGGKVQVSHLYSHSGAVHKLVICPDNPSEIISVGEDACICSKDLREDVPKVDMLKVFSTKKKTRKVRLFSISHHPFAPEICVSGSDQYVRVYDKRSMREPVHTMSPEHILGTHFPNVTCCVYNNTGTEILATYSEDNIYLFDNKNYVSGEYLHSYKGHFNQKTIKGVNFFGPNCEYVISGSDCGNIFYWDKNTEAILNFMPGDTAGVVNCLEPHPNTPILATSGLDHNIKIWTPNGEKHPPDLTKLTSCVRRNIRRTALNDGIDFDDGQMQFFIRQILSRHGANRRNRNRDGNDSDSDNLSSDDSSVPDIHTDSGDDDDDDVSNLRHFACGTQ